MTEPTREELAARYKQLRAEGKIPNEAVESNKATVLTFEPDPIEAQAVYMRIFDGLQMPDGPARYIEASRMLRAEIGGRTYGSAKAIPLEALIISTGGRPFQAKTGASAGQWCVRGFGLFQSLDPKKPFRGASSFVVYGLLDERTAAGWMAQIGVGRTYRLTGRLSDKAPHEGTLGKGQIGLINVTANDAGLTPVENGHSWPDPSRFIADNFPVTTWREILGAPKENAVLLVEGETTRATAITPKKGGGMMAVIQMVDDTISLDKPTLEATRGGPSVFLPPHEVKNINAMARSTRVRVLLTVSKRPELDQQQNPTGKMIWGYNAIGFWILESSTGGTTIPNPQAPVASIPQPPAGAVAPPTPSAPGVPGANTPSATDM